MGLFSKKTKDSALLTQTGKLSEEYARVIEWKPEWDTGAPIPQVFSNGHKIYLIYHISEPDPHWDGTYVTMIDNSSETQYPLALVEFDGGDFIFGIANDEVFGGLPLWNKGLEGYEAHIVENSKWIEELKSIHKTHPYYDEARWSDLNIICYYSMMIYWRLLLGATK